MHGGRSSPERQPDDASNLATVTYPNGVQTGFTYDQLNRVSALAASSASAEVSGYTYPRGRDLPS